MSNIVPPEAEVELAVCADDIVKFLRWLSPSGPWLLSRMHKDQRDLRKQYAREIKAKEWDKVPDNANVRSRTFTDMEKLLAWVALWNAQQWNVYFQHQHVTRTFNPNKYGDSKKRISKEDVGSISHFQTDFDPEPGETFEHLMERYRSKVEAVQAPSAVIKSGGGLNLLWRVRPIPLRTPEGEPNKAAWDYVEDRNRALERHFDGDDCHNVDRVLRLPGTINWPNSLKAAKGRVPVMSGIVELHEHEPYEPEDFPALAKPAASTSGAIVAVDSGPVELPDRLREIVSQTEWLPEQITKRARRGKTRHSNSELLLFQVGALCRAGVPAEQIKAMCRDPAYGMSEVFARREHSDDIDKLILKCGGVRSRIIINDMSLIGLVRAFHEHVCPTLLLNRGTFYEWNAGAYRAVEDDAIQAEIQRFLERAVVRAHDAEGKLKDVSLEITPKNVEDMFKTLKREIHRNDYYSPPCWLSDEDGDPPAHEIISLPNGLLHVPSGRLMEPTERFFTTNVLAFDYDPNATECPHFDSYLNRALPEDDQRLLMEVLGYLLLPDNSLHKAFQLWGAGRAGKSTAAWLIGKLCGEKNVAWLDINDLDPNHNKYGLWSLAGKLAGVYEEAEVASGAGRIIASRIKKTSGGISITAQRKYKDDWTGVLYARHVFIGNRMLDLRDASGQIADRMIILYFGNSIPDAEQDPDFGLKLVPELPAIFNRAVQAYRDLKARGRFVLSKQASVEREALLADTSELQEFIDTACKAGGEATEAELWQSYRQWHAGLQMKTPVPSKSRLRGLVVAHGQGKYRAVRTEIKDGGREWKVTGIRVVDPANMEYGG